MGQEYLFFLHKPVSKRYWIGDSQLIYTINSNGKIISMSHIKINSLDEIRTLIARGKPTTTPPPPQIQIKLGHILGNPNISIFDALEILKHITGMESVIDTCENARAAALIVSSDVPGIFDVLEILKALAGMESAVSG